LYLNPRWLVASELGNRAGVDYDLVLRTQRDYAHGEWTLYAVVRYDGDGSPSFRGLDLACGVKINDAAAALFTDPYGAFRVFPYEDLRRDDRSSLDAREFKRAYVGGGTTPAVALFSLLGFYNASGDVVERRGTFGATPGVTDVLATGVIFLAFDSVFVTGLPTPLGHEMIHLLTNTSHAAGDARAEAWYRVLNLFSQPGETLPLWNGRQGSEARVSDQTFRPDLLTLVSVRYLGVDQDQCVTARSSQWLSP
jgi:hypothetical protein